MKWYWWLLIIIISLNLLVIAAVAVFVIYDHLRTKKALSQQRKRQESNPGEKGS